MNDLNWEQYGIWIDGKKTSQICDDLDKASEVVGPEMNKKKTQYMKNAWCPAGVLKLEGRALEEVKS
ncbi:hypothetical protein OESDEN_24029 [Oesophagostomum dentatum]|uniref:Uncharacterized protein n=1 Tax=Oesophagostomum dentatum TaxID=61180 RepID=A0A0B1RXI5_OESDE|nr:hypothetical protein OESDEN_24029 [Oesophagostomum dentatum]